MEINSNSEVDKFISSLEKQTIFKILRVMNLLERFGFELGMPHSKNMKGGLFELRIKGNQEIRIFYCFHNGQIWLLSGFIKKTQKTPNYEIIKAYNKYKILMS